MTAHPLAASGFASSQGTTRRVKQSIPPVHPQSRRTGIVFALCLALSALTGCGYTQKPLFPTGIRTVAVPIFDNRSFYRGAERDLTEALIKEIETTTPYKVVAPAGADSQILGSIVTVKQAQLSRGFAGGLPQELEVRYYINFEWRNVRTGQIIRERTNFETVGRYVPSLPVHEELRSGELQAAQAAADAIVSVMRSDW